MERIKALINKLHQQSEENADPSMLMATTQLVQLELTRLTSAAPKQVGSSKVSVMLPQSNRPPFVSNDTIQETSRQPEYNDAHTQYKEPEYKEQPKVVAEPVKKMPEKEVQTVEVKKEEQSGWLYNRLEEIPTLAHQREFKDNKKEVREMNDVFGGNGSSLNDRLKTEKKELGTLLTDGPVRDLKKAIGINDRFVFLNELFRGDEAMYERSLKTINNFRIYPEAEYWIERELKVKLGWDENKETVKHFRQIVKRRFL